MARRNLLAALALALFLAPGLAQAVEPDEILADPALEARARAISSELRCMVCQNQSIDDSHADLARDLRLLVRERLKAGDSDQEIRNALVARYGEFVLLKPPLNAGTIVLWGLPFALLGTGALGLWLARRRTAPATAAPLSPEERAEIDRLVGAGRR